MEIVRDNQRGTAAIVVIGILAVIMILSTYSLQNMYQCNRLLDSFDRRQTARQLAEAGLEIASDIIHSSPHLISKDLKIHRELSQGSFIVKIKRLEDSPEFEVTSVGKCHKLEVTLSKVL